MRATVDLRTVNHRSSTSRVRTTIAPALEEQVMARIRGAIERGAVTVSIHVARQGATGPRIDEAAARASHAALAALAKTLGVPAQISPWCSRSPA